MRQQESHSPKEQGYMPISGLKLRILSGVMSACEKKTICTQGTQNCGIRCVFIQQESSTL
jgi:hypothetical protein